MVNTVSEVLESFIGFFEDWILVLLDLPLIQAWGRDVPILEAQLLVHLVDNTFVAQDTVSVESESIHELVLHLPLLEVITLLSITLNLAFL